MGTYAGAPAGSGKNFKKLVSDLKKKGYSEDSARRIAAAVGRRKYGKKKFQAMAAKGRKRRGGSR